ncbi:hypothetical protein FMM56_00970 [Campylobacter sp. LR264d]|uniref:hypothetical protein n=1 Tax=Campylobacter sp. LR264d TaxID=2593544 RepID=UPI0012394685|nr:hypothetical protein [Campylobacter sp. LR264d]KAA6234357.1 hypothetical protein FMM56_00970 [Campylobacter sp. LR264d]
MNATRFIQNLNQIQKTFFDSEFFKFIKNSSFSDESLATILGDFAKTAMQGALNLEELEMKDRELSLMEEKTRQELEIGLLNAKSANRNAQAETLKSLIQAESMVRSVSDNAAINKANSYVGFLNVVGNASESDAIASHSSNVVKTISGINTNKLEGYDEPLKKFKNEIFELINIGDGGKEVFIFSPKLELLRGEFIKIMGFTIYENTTCRFIINDDEDKPIYTRTLLYKSDDLGEIKIRFECENLQNEVKKDEIYLKIIDARLEKLH